ncbi:MFS transporter [Sphingomonas sp.]|uniref:MFS transporter n=1 Tax=Sphingomonas sp. TaxID=28214 RepID=UPI00286D9133|nr:MFS transporter [Sphingomonas sp.]
MSRPAPPLPRAQRPGAKPPRAKLPRNVWVLGFVSLLMDLSSEIYHALLPAFITVTLGLPAAAMGAIDGAAEGTASFAKLASGRLSDRSRRRKPWILAGYGLAALSKPLFPLAASAWAVMGARFADRVGKGIRGAPRDGMIADETPPELRGRAFGLRQSLDTVGALIAPIAAVGLMILLAGDIRAVFWIAAVPALLCFALAWFALKESNRPHAAGPQPALFAGFRQLDAATKRIIGVGFLFTLARFSEGFLILRALDAGVSVALSPLVLVLFNLGFVALAYPAGALSDRVSPKAVLAGGMALLIAADVILAQEAGLVVLGVGVLLWGAHMALTQGIFARMIADSAPAELRATSFGAFHFATGVGTLLASVGAGLIWDRDGAGATFLAGAGVAAVALAMLALLPDTSRHSGG